MLDQAEQLSESAAILTGQAPEPEADESPEPVEEMDDGPSASEKPDEVVSADEQDQPLTVTALAEKLGIKPEALYKSLQIDIDGTMVTLSDLKHKGQDLFKADELRELAESHKTDSENEILRARREIAIARERYQPTAEEIQAADVDFAAYVQVENEAAVRAIPEWKDPVQQKAGLDAIAELLHHYAFSPDETKTLVDHRYLKLMHDFASIRTRLKSAEKAIVKGKQKQKGGTRRKTPATNIDKALQLHKSGELSRDSTVAALIADGIKRNEQH